MNRYSLTDTQKELLRKLVKHIREEKLKEPIAPVGTDQDTSFRFVEEALLNTRVI